MLINSEWPSHVIDSPEKQRVNLSSRPEVFSSMVNEMADALSPRYHFVGGSDVYYQRTPYLNNHKYISRFLSLGSFPNSAQKYMYAFRLSSVNTMSEQELFGDIQEHQPSSNPYSNPTPVEDKGYRTEGYVQEVQEKQ